MSLVMISAFVSESCGAKETVVQRLANSMHAVNMQSSEFSILDKSRTWFPVSLNHYIPTFTLLRGRHLMGSQFLLFCMTVAPQVQNGWVLSSFEPWWW